MIVDKARIFFRAGTGGEGCSSLIGVSSRKIVGSGGDGGRGADIILKVNPRLYDLSKFKGEKKFIAQDGQRGKEKNKKGADTQNLIVGLPLGTRVIENQKLVVDLIREDDEFLICRGGRGGKGSYRRDYTVPSQEGQSKEVELDYRIPNDVAILGFANSGKTSLFNLLTNQNYKVAHYPFTTTSCIWANSECDFRQFKVLDTPPIKKSKDKKVPIENEFLRHIFRSKIVILMSENHLDFKSDFESLKQEIDLFDKSLLKGKKNFYLLNKIDKIDNRISQRGLITISTKERDYVDRLKEEILKNLA